MTEDSIPVKKIYKKPLDKDTANEYALKIQELHLKEIEHFQTARATLEDSDKRIEALEDGYLANLQMIKLAKQFPKKQYDEHQLERPCGCSYEDLEIPEWDVYIS